MAPLRPDQLEPADFPVAFGRYTLLGVLGEGGMARVFRAELQGPEGFRKPAALKVIHASVATKSERLRQSLIREARMGGLLQHPNIVETYEFGLENDLPYIAMEWVRGIGLDELLHLMRPLPAAVALEIGAQVCAGLAHAHDLAEEGRALGIVHRDLKPSNVIISREGIVKVMDFGIAKATTMDFGLTDSGMTKGTPAYMSPEQAGGEPLDRRSDLFALGALVYEMVCGRRLFDGESITAVLMKVVSVEALIADPETLAPLDRAVPGLAPVVYSCLRRDVSQRLEGAGELEQELRELMGSVPPAPGLKQIVRDAMLARGDDPASLGPPSRTPGSRAAEGRSPTPPSRTPPPRLTVPPTPAAGRAPSSPEPRPRLDRPEPGPTRKVSAAANWRGDDEDVATDPHNPTVDPGVPRPQPVGEPTEKPRGRRGAASVILVAGVLLLVVGGWSVFRMAPGPSSPPNASPHTRVEGPAALAPPSVVDHERAPAPQSPTAVASSQIAASQEPAAPTPTPPTTPHSSTPSTETKPNPPPVVARPPPGLSTRTLGRGTDGLRLEFRAILNAPADAKVTFWLNPKKSRWVSEEMRRLADGTWVSPTVVFPPETWGNAYYYVEVNGSARGPAYGLGTRKDPLRIKVQ